VDCDECRSREAEIGRLERLHLDAEEALNVSGEEYASRHADKLALNLSMARIWLDSHRRNAHSV
jgi:hypothetical protein